MKTALSSLVTVALTAFSACDKVNAQASNFDSYCKLGPTPTTPYLCIQSNDGRIASMTHTGATDIYFDPSDTQGKC